MNENKQCYISATRFYHLWRAQPCDSCINKWRCFGGTDCHLLLGSTVMTTFPFLPPFSTYLCAYQKNNSDSGLKNPETKVPISTINEVLGSGRLPQERFFRKHSTGRKRASDIPQISSRLRLRPAGDLEEFLKLMLPMRLPQDVGEDPSLFHPQKPIEQERISPLRMTRARPLFFPTLPSARPPFYLSSRLPTGPLTACRLSIRRGEGR